MLEPIQRERKQLGLHKSHSDHEMSADQLSNERVSLSLESREENILMLDLIPEFMH
jgi:hypothetical protein